MKSGLVSIVIVNWNGLKWLPECFGSLAHQEYKHVEIIFVDNASKDASVQWVRIHYPRTKIIINKTNLGFADANNVGFKVARGKYVLFLNNDTRVTKTFLSELVSAIETQPDIAGAQSKILLMDKPDTHDSVGAFLTPTGFLYHYGFAKKDKPIYDKQIDLYTAKGACMMFRKDVLDRVSIDGNIFNPDYFAYFEETDMCHRVWLAGYRIVYAYKSVIYHKMGATSSNLANAFVQYHSFKNRIATYIVNLGAIHLLIILPVHMLFTQLYAFLSLVRGNIALFLCVEKATWWNIRQLPHLFYLRRFVQNRIRKVPDSSFWPIIFRTPPPKYYFGLFRGVLDYEET